MGHQGTFGNIREYQETSGDIKRHQGISRYIRGYQDTSGDIRNKKINK